MASRNDIGIAWAWVALLGARPEEASVAAFLAAQQADSEVVLDSLDAFEADFLMVSLTRPGSTH